MLRIKKIMEEQNLTARNLADRLSVSPQYVGAVINNRENITITALCRFAEALGVTMPELFDGYVKPEKMPDTAHAFCPYCGQRLIIGRVKG